jgi:hypothetical protein
MSPSLLLRYGLFAVLLATGLPFAAVDGAPAPQKGVLGVAVANPSPQWQGALIARVAPEGAAARAGLRPQDLIVAADSQSIASASDLTAYVSTRRAGDRITLTVMRWIGASVRRIQVVATLGPAPARGTLGAAVPAQNNPAPPRPSAPTGAPAQGLTDVSWTTFTDPNESAFTIDVPRGWKVVGGIVRKTPLWPTAVVRVLSPDRRTLIDVGDPDSVPYHASIAASDYVRGFTRRAMSGACPGLSIVNVAELPDVERFEITHSPGPYNQWSAAQASFNCSGRQAGMAGEAIAVLQYMTSLHGGQAMVLAAFVTTTGQQDEADRLLNHMYSSFRQNPEWGARQQQMGQQLANGALARWRGEQRQQQQMDDAITNTAHFVGPGGQHYDLDASPRYQWLAPNGQTAGTDTPTPPAPGWQPLQRLPE